MLSSDPNPFHGVNRPMTVPMERVENRILSIRGHRVMLDADLAELYGVPTKALNQAVKRNAERFPGDFMFQLKADEAKTLRSQFGTSNGRGGPRYIPYAFTELGVAMLSSVLNSERAVQVNIAIMSGSAVAGDEFQRGAKQKAGAGLTEGFRASIQFRQGALRQGDVDPLRPSRECSGFHRNEGPHASRVVRVPLVGVDGRRGRNAVAIEQHPLEVGGDGLAGRFQRLLHRPSGRKASRQIRDADAVIAPFLLVNDDRVPHLKTSNSNRPAGRCFGPSPPGDSASGGGR